ncbi:MAG TPA: MoaD/ThiS family protein [Motilibacteraceae bacterium]|nr:MoaD/ThiS family protein [Motilibacteraceae bacterium]
MIGVTLRYWAAARAAAGTAEERLELPDGAELAAALEAARAAHGAELGRVLERCSFLVDEVRARPTTALADGSLVEVLPPFAGGSGTEPGAGRHRREVAEGAEGARGAGPARSAPIAAPSGPVGLPEQPAPAPADQDASSASTVGAEGAATAAQAGPVGPPVGPPVRPPAQTPPASPLAAAAALVPAALLTLGAGEGREVLVVALAVVQLALLAGWWSALRVPGRTGGLLLGALVALLADGLVLAAGSSPAPVPRVLGAAMLGLFAVQLARRDGRPDLVGSLTAGAAACALVGLSAALLAAGDLPDGTSLVAATALAAGGAAALAGLAGAARSGAGRVLGVVAALAVAVGAGAAAGGIGSVGPLVGALLGLAAGAVGALGQALGALLPGHRVEPIPTLAAAAALPVLLAAPLAYVLGRLLVG